MPQSFPNSSAIESISDVIDNKLTITWKNGKTYTYTLTNPENFLSEYSAVLSTKSQSIGRFVNRQIQENALQVI
jgi:hypothetical protein